MRCCVGEVRRKPAPRHLDLRLEAEPSHELDGVPDTEKMRMSFARPLTILLIAA